jgi:hypothetical protein
MFIDLQWWQSLIGILVLLGLSPAPWITAMLAGRLMTLGAHERRVADVRKADEATMAEMRRNQDTLEKRHDATIERLKEERSYERAAKDTERERSDKLADKLMSVTEEFGATTVHLLRSLPDVGERDERTG